MTFSSTGARTRRACQPLGCWVALGLVGFAGLRCTKDHQGPPAQTVRPNILLVTFDTTRADRIGAYGWRHARTPVFDRLAAEGIRFEQAYAPVPLTLPSHATMMTGLYPFYHGVRDNGTFRLDDNALTLAETLRQHGYQTGAAVAAFVLDHRFGLDQGFDAYSDDLPANSEFERFMVPYRHAADVVDSAVGWLQTTGKDRPFFLWAHFFDPHFPYLTPLSFPFYQGHPYDCEIAYVDSQMGRLLAYLEDMPSNGRPTVIVVTADHGESLGQHGENTHGYFVYNATLAVPLVIRRPDGSRAGKTVRTPVSLADVMPTILDLVGLPVPDELEIHGRSLVPLIEEAPGAPRQLAERPIYFECYAPAHNFKWAPVRGVRLGDDKLIRSPESELYRLGQDLQEGPLNNRYALEPELAERLENVLDNLLSTSLARPRGSGAAAPPDAEAMAKLQALGYLSGGATGAGPTETGADLKRTLPRYTALVEAQHLLGARRVPAALENLLAVVRDDPDNPRCLWGLAEAVAVDPEAAAEAYPIVENAARNPELPTEARVSYLVKCGRGYLVKRQPDRALTAFRQAVQLAPRNAFTQSWVAVACLHLGRFSEAVVASDEAVRLAPQVDSLAIQLGMVHICNGQPDKGADVWQSLLARTRHPTSIWGIADSCAHDSVIGALAKQALTAAGAEDALPIPARAAAWATVGEVHYNTGDYDNALHAFRNVRHLLGKDDVMTLWWLARSLTARGRAEEARPLLRQACELSPDAVFVVADLAVVEHQLGDTDRAVQLLSGYHTTHPDNVTGANNLAWILAEQGTDLDRALALAKNACRHRTSSTAFLDTLGWVHIRRGDGESAAHALQQAVALDAHNPTYHYHLGLAHRLAGEPEQARAAFARAVELAPGAHRPSWFQHAREAAKPQSPAEGR